MHYTYKTRNTCSSSIAFDLNGGIVTNVRFTDGCNGNLKAISKLIDGQRAQDVIDKCLGNKCGYKDTSCADQLAKALKAALGGEESGCR